MKSNNIPWIVAVGVAVLVGVLMHTTPAAAQPRALDPARLWIFSTDPAEVNWPVIFAAGYDDPTVNVNNIIFLWTFEGTTPGCTIRGRTNSNPCRSRVMDKTWNVPGIYRVALSASLQGGPATVIERTVTIDAGHPPGPMAQRHEVRSLTFGQWNETIQALWTLKTIGVYDHLVYIHQVSAISGIRAGTMRGSAHRGPAFLPWHRVYIRICERALQVAAGNDFLGMPYWDWTIDQALPGGPMSSPVWTNNFFGPSGDAGFNFEVRSGPFCSRVSRNCAGRWPLLNQLGGPTLERELGRMTRTLPSAYQINNIRSVGTYDSNPFNEYTIASRSFRQALEGWAGGTYYGAGHNGVHNFVGGSMGPMTSANDPVFLFHHCNIDRIWYLWQVQRNCYGNCYTPRDVEPTITQFTAGSVAMNGRWRLPGHHWSDAMFPWSLRPADVGDAGNSLKGYFYV